MFCDIISNISGQIYICKLAEDVTFIYMEVMTDVS